MYPFDTKGLKEAEKIKGKILRKKMGPKVVNGQYWLRGRKGLYQRNERLIESMLKRRFIFYGRLFIQTINDQNKQIDN